jgi:nucleotide-binding universal stress UspA family protein
MPTRPTIVAATDFSEYGNWAVQRAWHVARQGGANLELLHVVEGDAPEAGAQPRGADESLAGSMQLNALAASLQADDPLEVNATVEGGRVLQILTEKAADADLLVLGSQGKHPLRNFLVGSVADRLLQVCGKLMLVVKRQPERPYRQVVVAMSLDPPSRAALDAAFVVAPEAEIHIVHVAQPPFEGKLRLAGVNDADIEAYRQQAQSRALAQLNEWIQQTASDAQRITVSTHTGDVALTLMRSAEQRGADLIVVKKQRVSRIGDVFLGSVTRTLLADAGCDVLVVPPEPIAAER